ncbi:MAG: SUMF1/EgtB/PvdO family nonheme iron enzyme [Kofleriaceae bacterium]
MLADALVAAERVASESEDPSGYGEDDPAKRRAEIVQAHAVSLGHQEVDVTAFEIMEYPVTNAMWPAYMKKTGAAAPASWPPGAAMPADDAATGVSQAEAAAFAVHHGWSLPSEAEWQLAEAVIAPQLDGTSEYTTNLFAPYRGGDQAAFAEPRGQICARGSAAKLPPCIAARRGLAREHRFKFARFRCVR